MATMSQPVHPLSTLALVTTVGVLAACAGAPVEVPRTTFDEAIAAEDQGDLPGAERRFEGLARNGDTRASLALARVLIRRGKHAEAARVLEPLVEAEPQEPVRVRLLAEAWDALGKAHLVIPLYARTLRLRPDDVDAAVRLAELFVGAKLFREAEAIAAGTLAKHPARPDDVRLLVLHARAMAGRGRLVEAVKLARQAVALAPSSHEGWLYLGAFLRVQGELDAAIAAFRRAVEANPSNPDGLRNLGTALLERGDAVGALKPLAEAVRIAPDDLNAWNALGVARVRTGDLLGAAAALERALVLAPQSAVVALNLAEVRYEQGEISEALRLADFARSLDPGMKGAAEAQERLVVVRRVVENLCVSMPDRAAMRKRVSEDLASRRLPHDAAAIDASLARVKGDRGLETRILSLAERCKRAAYPTPSPAGGSSK